MLLLAVGASSGMLLPKAGAWMNGIKHVFGMLLLATAWWMMNSVLSAAVMVLGWAFLGLWSAALLGAFSLRAESLLIDPGLDDTGGRFFGRRGDEGEPVPGAEAMTEKLPAQRPSDLPPDKPV